MNKLRSLYSRLGDWGCYSICTTGLTLGPSPYLHISWHLQHPLTSLSADHFTKTLSKLPPTTTEQHAMSPKRLKRTHVAHLNLVMHLHDLGGCAAGCLLPVRLFVCLPSRCMRKTFNIMVHLAQTLVQPLCRSTPNSCTYSLLPTAFCGFSSLFHFFAPFKGLFPCCHGRQR